jgi:rubrerythrin
MSVTLPETRERVWEEKLLAHLIRHTEGEQDLLASYADLAADAPEHVRYLVKLILDDEARHHGLFQEMVNTLADQIEFRDTEPQVPYVYYVGSDRLKLIEETKRFIELEKQDLKDLKALERELKPVRHSMLLFPLVKMMELDTKKHIALLEFVRKTAKPPWR